MDNREKHLAIHKNRTVAADIVLFFRKNKYDDKIKWKEKPSSNLNPNSYNPY